MIMLQNAFKMRHFKLQFTDQDTRQAANRNTAEKVHWMI